MDAIRTNRQLNPRHWEWAHAACACCGNELIGMRKLGTRPPHTHHPLEYCIVGLQVSVN